MFGAIVAACGGSGSTPPSLAVPSPTPSPNPSATLAAGGSGQSTTLVAAGYAVNLSLPATSDGSVGTIATSLTTTLPSGFVAPSNVRRAPKTLGVPLTTLVYLLVTPSTTVTFASTPGFSFTLPAGTTLSSGASAGVAFYDPTQTANGWTSLFNAGTVSGQTISFPASSGTFTLKAGTTYAFALYSTAALVTPTPKVAAATGPLLVLDLTQTNLAAGTPVYIYVVGQIGTNTAYYLSQKTGTWTMTAMVPGTTATPTAAQCASNGDNVHFYTCDNNELNALPSPAASAINGANGTGGNYPSAWADYSIPATVGQKLALPLSAISNIPGIGLGTSAFSGRIYVSVGVPKIPFTPTGGNNYAAPVFGNNAGQPGEYTLYDWIEFSYDANGNFNGNTTQVNQYGFDLALSGVDSVTGAIAAPQTLSASRNTILTHFAGLTPPYGGTSTALGGVVAAAPAAAATAYPEQLGSTLYLRAIAPQTIAAVGAYPAWAAVATPAPGATCPPSTASLANTFDCPLTLAYAAWQTTPLVTHDTATGYYFGVVFPATGGPAAPAGYPAGALAFYTAATTAGPSGYTGGPITMSQLTNWVQSGALTYAFSMVPPAGSTYGPANQISSTDIWANFGSLTAVPAHVPAAPYKNVGKIIAAAFQRGIAVTGTTVATYLGDSTSDCGSPTQYYPAGGTWSPWAQYFHSISTPAQSGTTNIGLAYGFSYDDVCGQNPSIPLPTVPTAFHPGTVTITLGNF